MINERPWLSSLQVLLALCTVGFAADTADLVLWSGKIVTMDESGTIAEALAIKGDRILAVGTNDDIARFVGPATRKIPRVDRLSETKQGIRLASFVKPHRHSFADRAPRVKDS